VSARTSFDGEAGAEEKHDAWHHCADEGRQVLRPERKLDVCPVEQRQVTLICASSLRVIKQPTTLAASVFLHTPAGLEFSDSLDSTRTGEVRTAQQHRRSAYWRPTRSKRCLLPYNNNTREASSGYGSCHSLRGPNSDYALLQDIKGLGLGVQVPPLWPSSDQTRCIEGGG
jgi:hypothetical protein